MYLFILFLRNVYFEKIFCNNQVIKLLSLLIKASLLFSVCKNLTKNLLKRKLLQKIKKKRIEKKVENIEKASKKLTKFKSQWPIENSDWAP